MDTFYDVQHGEVHSRPLDPSVRERLEGAIEYLVQDTDVERGVLLRNDLSWIPFTNTVPPPFNTSLIRMGPMDFASMANLMGQGDFYGWLHSHPKWDAVPSATDIQFHQFSGSMLIYSVLTGELNEFTTPYIQHLEEHGTSIHTSMSFKKVLHNEQ